MPLWDVWKDGLSILPSYAGPPDDLRAALELIAARKVDVAATITHRIGLDETGTGFELVEGAGDSMKVIVEPWS
jgi:L-iditol 2-dehydrogenase